MEDPRERLTACISTAELERRWKAAREMMRNRGIDYLIMRNDEEFLGGYVKWFSDFSARHSYPYTVIFPVDDEMTTITCGPKPPGEPFPPEYAVRGVKARLAAPIFRRPERRLYAHGQGYELVERPAIRDDEPMKIQAGMNLTVHPFVVNDRIWATTCDNYLITERGAGDCLHKTPKRILEI